MKNEITLSYEVAEHIFRLINASVSLAEEFFETSTGPVTTEAIEKLRQAINNAYKD
jgi:hypothetical protein